MPVLLTSHNNHVRKCGMLKDLIKKILTIILYKSMPLLSKQEQVFLSELRMTCSNYPVQETTNSPPSEAAWLNKMNSLRDFVLNQDSRKFLRWDIVSDSMFIAFARYVYSELQYLKRCPDWDTRWKMAIIESSIGQPIPYVFYPKSSGNLIHHAFHIAQFEEKMKHQIHDIDLIFEFGGGYGSMCRLVHNLGFVGKYIIFDLPLFSALQVYYLKSLGLPVESISQIAKSKKGIVCTSDIHELRTLLPDQNKVYNAMMIATWSISEVSIQVRDSILSLLSFRKIAEQNAGIILKPAIKLEINFKFMHNNPGIFSVICCYISKYII